MAEIIITGGAGLQGSKLTKKLVSMGHSVACIDNGRREGWRNLDGVDVDRIQWDLREPFPELFRGAKTVFHLAANVGGVEYISKNDRDVMLDNLQIDANVVRMAREARIKKFVFASTACTYPIERQQEWDSVLQEDMAFDPVHPESGYGWAKLTMEVQLSKLRDEMEVEILRLFNVYGPGEDFGPESHAVPELIRKALFDEKVVVYGDGSAGRCFLYVDDAVSAYIAAFEKGTRGLPINIGHPAPVRIEGLATMIQEIAGTDKPVVFDPSKPEGVKGRVPDIKRAEKILDWHPKTTLIKGLKPTIDFVRSQKVPLAGIR